MASTMGCGALRHMSATHIGTTSLPSYSPLRPCSLRLYVPARSSRESPSEGRGGTGTEVSMAERTGETETGSMWCSGLVSSPSSVPTQREGGGSI
eukprot:scaffold24572_cov65-Phaeocystis_antarctica.AAC.8